MVIYFTVLLELNSWWQVKFSFVKWSAREFTLEGEGTKNSLEKQRKMNLGMVLKTLKNGYIFGSRTLKMLFMDSEKFGFVHGDYWLPTHCFHLPQNSFICLRVNTRVSSFYRQTVQEEINYFIHMVITVISLS